MNQHKDHQHKNQYHGLNILLHPRVQQHVNQCTDGSFQEPTHNEEQNEQGYYEEQDEQEQEQEQNEQGQVGPLHPEINLREEIRNNVGRYPQRIQEQLRDLKQYAKEKREFVQAISALKPKHDKLTKEIQMLSDEHFILDFSSAQIDEQVKIATVNVNNLKRKIKRLKNTKESLAKERLKLEREQRRLEREGEQLQSNDKRSKLNKQHHKSQQQTEVQIGEQIEKQHQNEDLLEKYQQLEEKLVHLEETRYIETLFEVTHWALKRKDQPTPAEYLDFDVEHREYAEQLWERQQGDAFFNAEVVEAFRKRFFSSKS